MTFSVPPQIKMVTPCPPETRKAEGVSAHRLWSARRSVRFGCTGKAGDRK